VPDESHESSSDVPVYRKIADELRAAILSGGMQEGDRLPGENFLMAHYGVARATARDALAVLRHEGLAVSRRGSGVYVRRFKPLYRHGSRRLPRERWESGQRHLGALADERPYTIDRLVVEEQTAPDPVCAALGLEPGTRVWARSRRYLVEGRPVQFAFSYFPAEVVAGSPITEQDSGPGGSYARLADLGHAPARFSEEINARMPTPREAEVLLLPPGTPVLVVNRTAYTAEDKPVEHTVMTMDASAYILRYDFPA
jgi:GntR family transcriptional regulator